MRELLLFTILLLTSFLVMGQSRNIEVVTCSGDEIIRTISDGALLRVNKLNGVTYQIHHDEKAILHTTHTQEGDTYHTVFYWIRVDQSDDGLERTYDVRREDMKSTDRYSITFSFEEGKVMMSTKNMYAETTIIDVTNY